MLRGWAIDQVWCLTDGRPVNMSGKNERNSMPLIAEQEQARAEILVHWRGNSLFSKRHNMGQTVHLNSRRTTDPNSATLQPRSQTHTQVCGAVVSVPSSLESDWRIWFWIVSLMTVQRQFITTK